MLRLTCNFSFNRNDYGEHGDNSYYGPVGLHSFPAGCQKQKEHWGYGYDFAGLLKVQHV